MRRSLWVSWRRRLCWLCVLCGCLCLGFCSSLVGCDGGRRDARGENGSPDGGQQTDTRASESAAEQSFDTPGESVDPGEPTKEVTPDTTGEVTPTPDGTGPEPQPDGGPSDGTSTDTAPTDAVNDGPSVDSGPLPAACAEQAALEAQAQSQGGRLLHVSAVAGNDANDGSAAAPLQTIGKALSQVQPGDVVLLRKGTYRELVTLKTSGLSGKPITIVGCRGEAVVWSGNEIVTAQWTSAGQGVMVATLPANVADTQQIFVDGKPQIEARWPNTTWARLWRREAWARASTKTREGKIFSDALKDAPNITSGIVVTNANHQFRTWSRPLQKLDKANRFLTYSGSLFEVKHKDDDTWWRDDYYYLTHNRKLLDAPSEWFYDTATKQLSLMPPGGSLAGKVVEYKARDFALIIDGASHIQMRYIAFFGAAIHVKGSDVSVTNCTFDYPSHHREVKRNDRSIANGYKSNAPYHKNGTLDSPGIIFEGDRNIFRQNRVGYSALFGIYMDGTGNQVANSVFHDINYFGDINFPAIHVWKSGGTMVPQNLISGAKVIGNLVYNVGNIGIRFKKYNNEIAYNHVFNGGLLSLDTALIYTSNFHTNGSSVHHNWIHDGTGIGLRLDGYSCRDMKIYNNVIWNVRQGVKISGDGHRVAHNTVVVKNDLYSLMFEIGKEEQRDAGDGGPPVLNRQNRTTVIFNNVAYRVHTRDRSKAGVPRVDLQDQGGQITNNVSYRDHNMKVVFDNFGNDDFRPAPKGVLHDKGVRKSGLTDQKYDGKPDIGALERGAIPPSPGVPVPGRASKPRTPKEASSLSTQLVGYRPHKEPWLDRSPKQDNE